ncbi:beta-ketoacyl synthase N-terminal-like domain-containing protein [Nocardia sp. NPDC051321]|uniref:beta-ketoacyl synthase N-terminal-like domain-containing protein n=1 Tax=Nocardia sp. NPDC051321 TaxID=3364323 RepID=UPI0037A362D0
MPALAITGWGMVSPAGLGPELFQTALAEPRPPDSAGQVPPAHWFGAFDVRKLLGRKGTSALDRYAALSMVAVGAALDDGAVRLDDTSRPRTGIVLGTTLGSLESTMNYSAETLVQERPYLVNPMLFPNTIMNSAAGQAAIRFGIKGTNSTIAGGPIAIVQVLQYAMTILHRGRADLLLAGATEEFTEQAAWLAATHAACSAAGEGAVIFVVERADAPPRPGARRLAEVLAVRTGFISDTGDFGIAECIRAVLADAGQPTESVAVVAAVGDDPAYRAAVDDVLGPDHYEWLDVTDRIGNAQAATGAFQLAAMMLRWVRGGGPRSAGSECALLIAGTADGDVGAVLLRGGTDVGHGDG